MSMIMQWDAVAAGDVDRVLALDEDAFWEWLEDAEGRLSFDVDKAWHAVHHTLTGEPWATDGVLAQAVLGGEPFGSDAGYGPPRLLPAADVVAVAEALAALTPDAFAARLDLAALARDDVYPSIWDRDPEAEDLVAFVCGAYAQVRDGFAAAAANGSAFVISLL